MSFQFSLSFSKIKNEKSPAIGKKSESILYPKAFAPSQVYHLAKTRIDNKSEIPKNVYILLEESLEVFLKNNLPIKTYERKSGGEINKKLRAGLIKYPGMLIYKGVIQAKSFRAPYPSENGPPKMLVLYKNKKTAKGSAAKINATNFFLCSKNT